MPCFVTLEGIEGCGKTTQAGLLADFVRTRFGVEVLLTREPGGTDVTRGIRQLLADPQSRLDARAELLLFLADRAQHVAQVLAPKLDEGVFVLCDRYSDSTLAYQGFGRGHPLDFLQQVNAWAARDLVPDLTLWIDCDLATGIRRATKRTGGPGDRFESEPLDFHKRVRDGFEELRRQAPDRIVRIEGDKSVEEVFASIREVVSQRLGDRLSQRSREQSGEPSREDVAAPPSDVRSRRA